MNGKHTDPAYDLEWGQTHGVMADAHCRAVGKALRREVLLTAAETAFWVGIIIAICVLFAQPAEAARLFGRQNQSSPCANGRCNVEQQAAVRHIQKVIAQPVVHHAAAVAAPVYAAPVVAQPSIHTQNNWYSVGQPLVQHSQLVAAARDAVAEQQFKATVQGSFNATVNGAAQSLYQQQTTPAPVYSPPPQQPAPQWTPPPEPQPPTEPEAPPTFSMTAPHSLPTFTEAAASFPAFSQHCAKCHAHGADKGGFSIERMNGEQFWLAAERVRGGTMPPAGPLAQNERDAVVQEMLAIQYPPRFGAAQP